MAINESQHPPTSGFGPSSFKDTQEIDESFAFPSDRRSGPRRTDDWHPPCSEILEVKKRLGYGDTAIHDIRTAQQELKDDTAEVLEILHNAKAFFRFAKFFGRLLAFFAPLVAVWLTWKGLVK
jgi:hypothetical protein